MTAENTISSEELAKDKYLLELIFNNYYEQERRFNSAESKISSMISFIGVIFTIQATIFTGILIQLISAHLLSKLVLSFVLIISSVIYVSSLYMFIESYNFGKFKSTPNPHDLCNKSQENVSEGFIVKNLIFNIPKTIDSNEETMQIKINKAKSGFRLFKIGSYFTLIFVIILLVYILTL